MLESWKNEKLPFTIMFDGGSWPPQKLNGSPEKEIVPTFISKKGFHSGPSLLWPKVVNISEGLQFHGL